MTHVSVLGFEKNRILFSLFFHCGVYSFDLFNHVPDKCTKDRHHTCDMSPVADWRVILGSRRCTTEPDNGYH